MTTVGCDIDGTLIDYVGKPRYEIINLLAMLKSLGCEIFIWSGGGLDYSKTVVDRFGLNYQVVEKGSIKVDIAIDDMEVQLGKVNMCVFNGQQFELDKEKL
jgi:hydroxymethylpyrimidine pyrophosphatase-like HAD family hydrolase